MATKASFTPDEWTTIVRSPLMAGMAVVFTSGTGPLQAVLEMSVVAKALATDGGHTGNGLIQALHAAVKSGERPAQMAKPASIEQARSQALEQLQRTGVLVDQKAPEDAAEFKAWLSGISMKVAEAAKEGSFLGFGGTQVTDEERAAVADVARALGISPADINAPPDRTTTGGSDAPDFGSTLST